MIIRMLCELDMRLFKVTYFWCEPGTDIGSDFVWPELDYANIDLLKSHGIDVVKFVVAKRDIRNRYHPWLGSDFFERYAEVETDIVLTSRSGQAEYPFFLLAEPVVEWNNFGVVDHSPNLVHSVSNSDWTHRQWLQRAGRNTSSSLIYPGVPLPTDADSLRDELRIASDTVVLGFHQRNDEHIYGEHALRAYAKILPKLPVRTTFVILGGSPKYRNLVDELGIEVEILPIAKDYETVSRFLKTLDIFAHSGGAGETLAVVVQEAMVHGLPSITMRLPGRPDGQVATMAGSGIVTNSIDEYAEAINYLVNTPSKRQELGEIGGNVAISRYSMPAVGREFSELLAQIFQRYRGVRFAGRRLAWIRMQMESNAIFRQTEAVLRKAIKG